jgi:RimJ/RimL family protein N-acetyltransferase
MRELTTGRLRLVPLSGDDVDALLTLWRDAGVRRWLWDDREIERDEALEQVDLALARVEERGYGFWTLHLRDTPGVIGFCGFKTLDASDDPELMYGLYPEHWGRGLAVEASRAALDELFATLSPARVWALADPPNAQSFRVMEKLGMRFDRDGEAMGLPARYYVLERAG